MSRKHLHHQTHIKRGPNLRQNSPNHLIRSDSTVTQITKATITFLRPWTSNYVSKQINIRPSLSLKSSRSISPTQTVRSLPVSIGGDSSLGLDAQSCEDRLYLLSASPHKFLKCLNTHTDLSSPSVCKIKPFSP